MLLHSLIEKHFSLDIFQLRNSLSLGVVLHELFKGQLIKWLIVPKPNHLQKLGQLTFNVFYFHLHLN